jgi:Kef-type K+ transport system membrane component KefB
VVLSVAAACLIVPFALGLVFGYYSAPHLSPQAQPLHSALFVATAFSITALPILGRILIELDLSQTPLAVIAISAAAINDVIGWVLLAVITALTVGDYAGYSFAMRLGLIALYALLCVMVVRPLLKHIVRRSNPQQGKLSSNLTALLLAVIFVSAMTTYRLGIFAIFGGFMIGVILFDEAELVRAWRERIGDFVYVFFLPIFFTYTGLRTSIGALDTLSAWGWCALTVALATLGKLGAAYVAARLQGRAHAEAAALGFMMNTRALMELVVLNIGLDLGVISQQMFTMLVIMAIISTLVTTPALRHYLPRAGLAVPL